MVDWLLNSEHVGWAGQTFAAATPILALIALVLLWPKRRFLIHNGFFWAFAACGPLVVILWFLYNAIENALGLDNVFALIINLTLFCLIGLAIGAILLVAHKRQMSSRNGMRSSRKR